MMNEGERLQLQKMIQANGTQDLTEEIRRTKHSLKIRTEAFDLAKREESAGKTISSDVFIPYAKFLESREYFDEAQVAYRKGTNMFIF